MLVVRLKTPQACNIVMFSIILKWSMIKVYSESDSAAHCNY